MLGDAVNYWIGYRIGPRVFASETRGSSTEAPAAHAEFYEKYGGKTIILARFVPIIRTFAPFVAGVGRMSYRRFAMFNVIGAFTWVTLFLFARLLVRQLAGGGDNFSLVILAIIVLSLLPIVIEFMKARTAPARPGPPAA